MPGGLSECEPPDPIPNSEVKPLSADGSVGVTHVRVGHRQAFYLQTPDASASGVFYLCKPRSSLIRLFPLRCGERACLAAAGVRCEQTPADSGRNPDSDLGIIASTSA